MNASRKTYWNFVLMLGALMASVPAGATLITFDGIVEGQNSMGFDGDGDGVNDAVFTTFDSYGYQGFGPFEHYENHIYLVGGYVLGTSSLDAPDLRVDFLFGAEDSISFAFVLEFVGGLAFLTPPYVDQYTTFFELFDRDGNSLGSTLVDGYLLAGYDAEGVVSIDFYGQAAYGLFDFVSYYSEGSFGVGDWAYIDNFQGNFGSTGIVPEPASVFLLGIGVAGMVARRKTKASTRSAATGLFWRGWTS